jgi:hypothetical protein
MSKGTPESKIKFEGGGAKRGFCLFKPAPLGQGGKDGLVERAASSFPLPVVTLTAAGAFLFPLSQKIFFTNSPE